MKKNIFTKEFKEQAVTLVLVKGIGIKQASQELGVSKSALGKWVSEHRVKGVNAFPGSGKLSPEEQKTRDLEKRIRVLEMERDILKKATAFFAKESL